MPIDHSTHVPVPFSQSSAESEYNTSCNQVMSLAYFRVLIHEFLNRDPDLVPEEAPLIILDSNSAVCMAKNDRDTEHIRNIPRRMHLVRNSEKFKMHNIYWCEVRLQLADIATKNVGGMI